MAQKQDTELEGLQVEVVRNAPGVATVRFTVPHPTLAKTRNRVLKNLGKRFRVKGFRPGKAPVSMIEKQFGGDINHEVLEHVIGQVYRNVLKEEELRPAASPQVDEEPSYPSAGEPLEGSFSVPLRPDIELGKVKGIEVAGQDVQVTEEETDHALEDLRRQASRREPADEEGLPDEGMAECHLTFTVEGKDEPILDKGGFHISPGTAPFGIAEEDFKQAVLGAKKDEEREVAMTYPDDFPIEEARGKGGALKLRFEGVFRVIPPTTEELCAMLEVSTEAGMKEAIRAKLLDRKQEMENHRIENELIEKVLEAHPMELPDLLIEGQVQGRLQELRESLTQGGLPEEEIQGRLDAERPQAEKASRDAMKAIYLFEEIAKAEDLLVKAEDFDREFASIARRNETTPQAVRKYYSETEGLINRLGLELLERKVRSFLRESADIQVTQAQG